MRRSCSKRSARKKAGNVSEGGGSPAPWKGNIRGPSAAFSKKPKKVRSWVEGARAANNPLLVEGTFRTGTQQHACLEPHAAVARFDGDRLTVHVSTQAVFHVMELIAKRYKLGHDKVRVIADHVGGGFGSKGSLGVETTTAIELAREAKAPVRVAYDRHEELSVTGYRPATEVKIALLPSEQGELKALSLTAYADTGAATNSTIAALARLIYPAEAKELADFDVISNLPAGAPFRGPGGPPMAFALEQAIDEAALRMNVDPIALRKRWDPDPNRQRLYDWASGLDVWRNRKPIAAQSGRYRRGVGVATGYWLYLWQPGSKVEVAVKGGRLIASTATQDIGTGTRTVIANTVAQRIRAGAARDRGQDRQFKSAGRTGLGRQPGHGFGDPADAAGDRAAEGLDPATREAATGPRLQRAVARTARGLARSQRFQRAAGRLQADRAGRPVAAEAGRLHGHRSSAG